MNAPINHTDNSVIVEAWNTVLFEKFSRFRHLLTTGLSDHSDELFRRRPYPRGARVLDVGCGFGDTALQIAAQVGARGSSVGVDCARNFVDSARREAADADISNASFFVADVERDELRGSYDHVFSRFGTMFFNLPSLALGNIRRALKPDGELTMIVWRRREDNPWVHLAEQCVRKIVPVVSHESTDEVHCGPGPFSMAGADMVSDLLRSAGYDRIAFQRYDTGVCIGSTLVEAIEFALALGPAGEIIRLAGEEGEKRKDEVLDALGTMLLPHVRPDGIRVGSSSWIISARNPAT